MSHRVAKNQKRMVNILLILLISVVLFGLYDIKRQSRTKRALPRSEPGENTEKDQHPES